MKNSVLLALVLLASSALAQSSPSTNCKPSLAVDRTAYLIGEAPTYTIACAPAGEAILWSSSKDGVSTGENDLFYGQTTDEAGNWQSAGGAWEESHTGFWEKRAAVGTATLKVFFVVAPTLTPQTSDAKDNIGVTHVGGLYRFTDEPFLLEGAYQIQNLGAQNVFIQMSPRYATEEYPDKPGTYGAEPVTSLTDLAKTAPFREFFAMPFRTFAITAFTFGNWDYWNGLSEFDASREEREANELYEFTRYLMLTYAGTGKAFLLKTWESDWLMNRSYDLDAVASESRIQSMIKFFNARHRGIKKAREEMPWIEGVKIIDAPEINLVKRVQNDIPSLLNLVIPFVESDAIAYSSWNSLGGPTSELYRRILDDIAFIRNFPGVNGRPLLITEYGFSEVWNPGESAARTFQAVSAFLDAGITNSWFWELYDNPGADGLGLVRPDGSRSPAANVLVDFLTRHEPGRPFLSGSPCTIQAGENSCTTAIRYSIPDDGTTYYAWTNGSESWSISAISGRGELTLTLRRDQTSYVRIFYWTGGCEGCGEHPDVAGLDLAPLQ